MEEIHVEHAYDKERGAFPRTSKTHPKTTSARDVPVYSSYAPGVALVKIVSSMDAPGAFVPTAMVRTRNMPPRSALAHFTTTLTPADPVNSSTRRTSVLPKTAMVKYHAIAAMLRIRTVIPGVQMSTRRPAVRMISAMVYD